MDGTLVHGSWDYGVAEGTQKATIWRSGDADAVDFKGSYAAESQTTEIFFPAWNQPQNDLTFPSQLTDLPDINLDGFDDFALVLADYQGGPHRVRIYSGVPGTPPAILWELSAVDAKPLLGTPGFRRTSVTRLGDVNGDGSDDWGVITGIDSIGDPTVPDKAIALIYGTNIFPIEPQIPAPMGTPKLGGNRMTEIGRRFFVHITNGVPGQHATLFSDTKLDDSIPECGGTRQFADTDIVAFDLIFDGNGEIFYFESITYNTSLIGTRRYFQARAEPYMTYVCRLSTVREIRIEDLSDRDKR